MYSSLSTANLVVAFHATDETFADKLLGKSTGILKTVELSRNEIDWLSDGFYFWESDYLRAISYAKELESRKKNNVKKGTVVGAIIELGTCFDLTNAHYRNIYKHYYKSVFFPRYGDMLEDLKNSNDSDILLRKRDRAILTHMFNFFENKNEFFDSARGAFEEGKQIFSGSSFRDKTHVQISLRNLNCIKGFFRPLEKV